MNSCLMLWWIGVEDGEMTADSVNYLIQLAFEHWTCLN